MGLNRAEWASQQLSMCVYKNNKHLQQLSMCVYENNKYLSNLLWSSLKYKQVHDSVKSQKKFRHAQILDLDSLLDLNYM